MANVILTNGARLYVDHAHPEYSSPEVTNPARCRAVGQGRRAWSWLKPRDEPPECRAQTRINLYKNNTDNKGASYGTHENYLMRRSTPFTDIVKHLTPFFVSRQVICGQGRVGCWPAGHRGGFPDQPTSRLLRGRGGARDDSQAPDHQHPRRATR